MPAADLTLAPSTDPTALYRYRDCIYADDLLITGLVHLDFFTWLHARGTAGFAEICDHFQLKPRGADVMLTLFKARDLLTGPADGPFALSPTAAEHLVAGSPWFLGPYYASLQHRQGVQDLLHVLRTGQAVFWGGKQEKKEDWHAAMIDDEYAAVFTAGMDCRGVHLAQAAAKKADLTGITRLLDIAGGSGIYACSFCAHHPHLTAAVLEQPPVDQIAAKMIERRGYGDRVSVVPGDIMTAPLPAGFDAHLWSNVLHDWDEPEVRRLLAASAAALAPGSLLLIHDAFLNDEKSGPLHVAEYSVVLAHATQGRCYSTAEMRTWLAEAGFKDFTHTDTAAARGLMTARRI